jgi:hypothetical protein
MSDSVGVALISGAFGLVNTAVYILFLRSAGKTREHMKELADNTNSKMDRLLEVTGQAEFAKGVKHEKDRAENDT